MTVIIPLVIQPSKLSALGHVLPGACMECLSIVKKTKECSLASFKYNSWPCERKSYVIVHEPCTYGIPPHTFPMDSMSFGNWSPSETVFSYSEL